ncbi:uncharacterized protein ACR2FA_012639 [Aphomia sociella]
MGCTSSAPNMVASHVNTTEKMLQFPEESHEQSLVDADVVIHTDDGNGENEIKVLPSCDTLDESIQLDRNNKSVINITNMDVEKDTHANGHVVENNDTVSIRGDDEEKISSMKEVVEKVVELYGTENAFENIQNFVLPFKLSEGDDVITTLRQIYIWIYLHKGESKGHEKLEEAISPTQSTSSRATRWEALADIAAELPPSLTVDPITGQIYSVTK